MFDEPIEPQAQSESAPVVAQPKKRASRRSGRKRTAVNKMGAVMIDYLSKGCEEKLIEEEKDE